MAFVNPAQVIQTLNLKEGSVFADFGAGSGAYVLAAIPLVGETGKIYAIDIQKDLLLKLKQTITQNGVKNVSFLWCNFEKLGSTQLQNASVDVVLLSNTLFQLDDKNGAFKEAYRILKETGHLFVIDWSESYNGMGPETDRVVTKSSALDYATANGFVLHNEFNPGEHHYGMHFIKQ